MLRTRGFLLPARVARGTSLSRGFLANSRLLHLEMKKLDAYTTYLTMTGADSALAWFIFTVSAIYQVTVVGLDPLQLVLVGTTLEVTAFFFEVPTGVVADVYSRKLSIVIGYVMMGIGFIVEGAFPFFATVLLA
ncbi:MAG: hypothetical protein L0Y55_14670, partial [Anaerolineales bacterium]|nr:hypothetical protein [Anaerolineales bacterium]